MTVKNGFNLKTIHKLIRKHKSKQNKITVLMNQQDKNTKTDKKNITTEWEDCEK